MTQLNTSGKLVGKEMKDVKVLCCPHYCYCGKVCPPALYGLPAIQRELIGC